MTDPIDEMQPPTHAPDAAPVPPAAPVEPVAPVAPDPAADPAAGGSGGAADAAPTGLRIDPAHPSDPAWREPAWYPPRDGRGRRDRRSGTFAIVVGLILIAIGAWYFLETTLALDLPRISWGSLWPAILIVIGGLILIRSIQRRP